MADRDDEHKEQISENLTWLWVPPGVVLGISALAKYMHYIGNTRPDDLMSVVITVALAFGPSAVLISVAELFRKEVQRGRMSWEEYWIVLSGIVVAAFAFLGITGVDDIAEALALLSRSS
ncbi:hypothetical protein [Nocardiopsis chromatogenes]|uniref:hypothetical protein n=1 Tax=Nocardiopsis chromatogenes TaxID=280239 RepID=UPI000372AE41|nr:hypothetical protein [Nocardiopsis chromatogenes]